MTEEKEKKRFNRYVYLKRFTDHCALTDGRFEVQQIKIDKMAGEIKRNRLIRGLILMLVILHLIVSNFK